jgi:hypothetical protein
MDSAKPCALSFLRSKVQAINAMLGHKWTGKEIQQKVKKQERLSHLLKWKPRDDKHQQQQAALVRRNKENRRLNEEQVRGVLLAERKKKKDAIKAAQLKREEAARKEASGEDPDSQATTPEYKEISKYIPRDYKKGLKDFTRVKNDDDIIAEMDFDIDIDIGL